MIPSFGELNINAYHPHKPEGVTLTPLFAHEELRAELVVLPPHNAVPLHFHEHAHELFDVIDGQGTFLVDGIEFPGGAGPTRCSTGHPGARGASRGHGRSGQGPGELRHLRRLSRS